MLTTAHARTLAIAAIAVGAFAWSLPVSERCEALSGRDRASMAGVESEHGGLWHDAEAQERISRIGDRICRRASVGVPCCFRLLDTPEMNAYSLSCGCVYLTRGLYAKLASDDLIAAALAHEIGHVVMRDGKHPCSATSCRLEKELRADAAAVRYLKTASYPASAIAKVVRVIRAEQPEGWADARLDAIKTLTAPDEERGIRLAAAPSR